LGIVSHFSFALSIVAHFTLYIVAHFALGRSLRTLPWVVAHFALDIAAHFTLLGFLRTLPWIVAHFTLDTVPDAPPSSAPPWLCGLERPSMVCHACSQKNTPQYCDEFRTLVVVL
jgi:hypothetical protein